MWALGYPDAALADVDQAFKHAREIGHAATLLYALTYLPLTHIVSGNFTAAKALVDEGTQLAVKLDASLWKANLMMMHGLYNGADRQIIRRNPNNSSRIEGVSINRSKI
jgi:hypothetical protein